MKNRHKYSVEWWDTIRPAILKRDNYKCQHCRIAHRTLVYKDAAGNLHECDKWLADWAITNGYKVRTIYLQVIHLDQDPSNNDFSNLSTACPSCHFKFDNKFNKLKRLASRATRGLSQLVHHTAHNSNPPNE